MSKYMHLTVTVPPYYEKNLEQTYPKLARNLKYLNATLVERNPFLYELVGNWISCSMPSRVRSSGRCFPRSERNF